MAQPRLLIAFDIDGTLVNEAVNCPSPPLPGPIASKRSQANGPGGVLESVLLIIYKVPKHYCGAFGT